MKLSIITVNLNNLHGLRKTMNSILSQTCKDFEWIVIDGGSTDGSKELIEQSANHITYWVSEPDNGIFDAMNKGINVAHGDYLLFLNSGDYLYGKTVIEIFINHKSRNDVIYGNTIVVNSTGEVNHKWITPKNLRFSSFFKGGISHQSAFISKNCFDQIHYENHIGADTELFIRLLARDYSFEKYEEFVSCYDNSGVSSTINYKEYCHIVMKSLPLGAQEDYVNIIQFLDVDLAKMIIEIIKAPRLLRNITRFFVLPLSFVAKLLPKE